MINNEGEDVTIIDSVFPPSAHSDLQPANQQQQSLCAGKNRVKWFLAVETNIGETSFWILIVSPREKMVSFNLNIFARVG